MGDIAIFTEEIAMGLMARGFELVTKTNKFEPIWYFEDSVSLRVAVDELLEALQEVDR